jgi:hypothetical protein
MLRLVRTSAIAAFTGTLRIICASPSGALRDFPSCVEMESNLELVVGRAIVLLQRPCSLCDLRPLGGGLNRGTHQ